MESNNWTIWPPWCIFMHAIICIIHLVVDLDRWCTHRMLSLLLTCSRIQINSQTSTLLATKGRSWIILNEVFSSCPDEWAHGLNMWCVYWYQLRGLLQREANTDSRFTIQNVLLPILSNLPVIIIIIIIIIIIVVVVVVIIVVVILLL